MRSFISRRICTLYIIQLLLGILLSPAALAADPFTSHYNLSVNASGASAVPISGSFGYSGVTGYTRTGISSGTGITLVAPAMAGNAVFNGWVGCQFTSGLACTVTMTGHRFVTVQYSSTHMLNVSTNGAASVPISATGGYSGTTNYTRTGIANGTSITLTAPVAAGNTSFAGWYGCDQVSGVNCTVTMTNSKSVGAYYSSFGLTLSVTTSGATAVPISLNSAYGGTSNYLKTGIPTGTNILLAAPAAAGAATFSSWTGCDSVVGNDCSISMQSSRSVSANYATPAYNLSVLASGASAVAISSTGSFGGTANYTKAGIPAGTGITLTAPATAGNASFSSWNGCDTAVALACTVTMNSSKTVAAHYVTPAYTLTVLANGASAVPISSSGSYGGTANYTATGIPAGTSITLTAPASMGTATFSNWSGCDTTSTVTCTVAMGSSKFVTATYATLAYDLSVIATGAPPVTISNNGGYGGTTDYTKTGIPPGTVISLTAPTSIGSFGLYTLTGWSGCGSYNLSTGLCTVSMDSSKFVVAQYGPAVHTLSVIASGASSVAITGTGNSGGIANYTRTGLEHSSSVTLTAPAMAGTAAFSSWSGCDAVANTACTVLMESARFVTANYAVPQYILSVTTSGASAVVISNSGSYGGTANYTVTGITAGTSITLTAPATAGTASFSNWTGCDSAAATDCTVAMDSAKFVSANYGTPEHTLGVTASGASAVPISSGTGHGGTTDYTLPGIAAGTSITLTAPATAGSATFSSWTGCDSTAALACTVTLSSSKFVTVNYVKSAYALHVLSSGASAVAISNGNNFGGITSYTAAAIAPGTSITLTAPATAGGKNFATWTGCDSTSSTNRTCTVSMNIDKTVTVSYGRIISDDLLVLIASDRILGSILASDGTVSTARFTAGASRDGGLTFGTAFNAGDEVTIAAGVQPQAADIGRAADVFVVIRTIRDGISTWTYKTDSGFKPWNGRLAELEPAAEPDALGNGDAFEVWDGPMEQGSHRIFIGYQLVGSAGGAGGAGGLAASVPAPLHYNAAGLEITVTPVNDSP